MRFESKLSRLLVLSLLAAVLAGCPMEDDATPPPSSSGAPPGPTPDAGPPAEAGAPSDAASPEPATPTHSGLVSVQDIAIANLPAAGHGLTVTTIFTPLVAPDFSDSTDDVTGCRAWSYDLPSKPPPPEQDHGELRIGGTKNGGLSCRFVGGRGYICPTAEGQGAVVMGSPSGATTSVTVAGATFTPSDVGRYLALSGATNARNNASSAIVAVTSPTEVVVVNPNAVAESFSGSFFVLAGAGPTPNDLYAPFASGGDVTIELLPNATSALEIPKTAVSPGSGFTLDEGSSKRITRIPVTGESVTLGCAACGSADATIVRITTTDGDVSNLSPVAMPPPKKKLVEVQCIVTDASSVVLPAGAMDLLRAAHVISPITRIRTAFMRDGVAAVKAKSPKPPNTTYVVAGHGILGFTTP